MPATVCPHCDVGVEVTISCHDSNGEEWGVGRCPLCDGIFFLRWEEGEFGDEVTFTHPAVHAKASQDIRGAIREFYEEALRCVEAEAPNGALVMCRRALEEPLNDLGGSKGQLPKRLERLVKKHIITPDLKDWADHARIGGKLAAHGAGGEEWGDESLVKGAISEAKDVLLFMEAFFEYVYVIPARNQRRRTRTKPPASESETGGSEE